jgi:hypothetical protein
MISKFSKLDIPQNSKFSKISKFLNFQNCQIFKIWEHPQFENFHNFSKFQNPKFKTSQCSYSKLQHSNLNIYHNLNFFNRNWFRNFVITIVEYSKVRFWGSHQWHNTHTKFHPNPSSGSRFESCGQTDGQTWPAHNAFSPCTLCKERITTIHHWCPDCFWLYCPSAAILLFQMVGNWKVRF